MTGKFENYSVLTKTNKWTCHFIITWIYASVRCYAFAGFMEEKMIGAAIVSPLKRRRVN